MAAINDSVYARVREKVKEQNLSEQELKAVDTAREQLQTHTYTGGLIGATTAFFLGKKKKFNPIQLLALTGGGFLMGTQMGVISGALAGVKTIQSLPDPKRLIGVVREVQIEAMKGRQSGGGGAPPTISPHQMTPQELHEAQSPQDQFSPDHVENQQGGGKSAWNNKRSLSHTGELDMTDETDPLSRQEATATTRHLKQQQQQSAWDKIRAESLPNNTWSKIRMQAQKNPDDEEEIAKAKAARASRLRENAEFSYNNVEELPRTREEDMQRGTSRKNQWGDPL
ncbi:hypothetical protein INT47_011922 [Mucor saturninus]|uniref:Uncharacterized protein n=1 Tax=Mucor saturninus TaxID=64648 RepID=A0A8H7QTF8_9FUNG|nr:hypothetical protein INT47_011922 [Mucor saturninus]